MTIREELEILGPERVRRGMVAFEHRQNLTLDDGACRAVCCFLSHAMDGDTKRLHYGRGLGLLGGGRCDTATTMAFEGAMKTRRDLYAECMAFLAEHGTAPEVAPVSLETVGA